MNSNIDIEDIFDDEFKAKSVLELFTILPNDIKVPVSLHMNKVVNTVAESLPITIFVDSDMRKYLDKKYYEVSANAHDTTVESEYWGIKNTLRNRINILDHGIASEMFNTGIYTTIQLRESLDLLSKKIQTLSEDVKYDIYPYIMNTVLPFKIKVIEEVNKIRSNYNDIDNDNYVSVIYDIYKDLLYSKNLSDDDMIESIVSTISLLSSEFKFNSHNNIFYDAVKYIHDKMTHSKIISKIPADVTIYKQMDAISAPVDTTFLNTSKMDIIHSDGTTCLVKPNNAVFTSILDVNEYLPQDITYLITNVLERYVDGKPSFNIQSDILCWLMHEYGKTNIGHICNTTDEYIIFKYENENYLLFIVDGRTYGLSIHQNASDNQHHVITLLTPSDVVYEFTCTDIIE